MNGFSRKIKDGSSPLNFYGDVQKISRIFSFLSITILVSLTIEFILLYLSTDFIQAAFVGGSIPLVLISLYLISKREFEKTALFLVITLFLLITIISTSQLGIHHIANLGFPAILIVASLVIRKKTLYFLTAFAILCAAWLVFGELLGLYTPKVLVRSVPGDFFSVAIIFIATALMVRLLTESLYQSGLDVQKELNERKRAEEQLAFDTLHDALTGLPNRTLFNDHLKLEFDRVHRRPQALFAVLFIDLDRFKVVNDSLGHTIGDQMLIATAHRLIKCLRPEDTVSRLSGDEFAILLADIHEIGDAIRVAERIQIQLSSSSMLEKSNWVTTASIGIAAYNTSYTYPQELLRDADSAMYRAKAKGGGYYEVFDETMYTSAMALWQMEDDLKRAVENQEWQVYYQPIVTLPDRTLAGVEALVRWMHPQRGIINPGEFIQLAEETGLILPIGKFVLQEACKQMKTWRENGHSIAWISVNLSGRQFHDPDLVTTIVEALDENGLSGGSLRMEITESVAMSDLAFSAKILQSLAGLGIQISLDDFGNGYSSLGYLNRFPINILKIDRSFISEIEENQSSQAITSAIISMGHALHMEVVAEGVETEQQLAFLQGLSCDKIQGFLISRPVQAGQIEKQI
jgi:diguanylate cyclase (GGDEF)-like protein